MFWFFLGTQKHWLADLWPPVERLHAADPPNCPRVCWNCNDGQRTVQKVSVELIQQSKYWESVCACVFSWYVVASLIVYDLQLLWYMHTLMPLTGKWYCNVLGCLEIQACGSSCSYYHTQILDLTFCCPAEVNTSHHLLCLYACLCILWSFCEAMLSSDNVFVTPVSHRCFWTSSVGVNKHGSNIIFSHVKLS